MEWGRRVRDFRSVNGLTQEAFAEWLGVSRPTVSRWESGKEIPSLFYRRKIMSLTPTVQEGMIRGMMDFLDGLDGMATLLDSDFKVLRTTRPHQLRFGYDPAELYGQDSERYWSEEMARIIKALGGLRGYKRSAIRWMDLVISREANEGGYRNHKRLTTVGRTVSVGDPCNPACHMTTLRLVESEEELQPLVIMGLDGEIDLGT